MASTDESAVWLAEYDVIKQEQRARITHRDGLVYTSIASLAAVIAAVISSHSPALLLVLPPLFFVFGWGYLANDIKVSGIGRYIRSDTAPRLAALSAAEGLVLGWEQALRSGRRRRAHKLMQLLVDLITFCVVPLAALVTFWVLQPFQVGLVLVSGAESLLVLTLAVFVVVEAGVGLRRPKSGS